MKVGSLFSGIGGFDLGLEMAGMEITWQVEIDPYCIKVLEKHWPNVRRYGDIFEINTEELERVDVICGGFPCQPFSLAGRRKGKADDRFIWPEMLRIIRDLKPTWIIAENVVGIINVALDDCISDLESEGYSTGACIIPACSVGAPHRRDRVWILANLHTTRQQDRREQCRRSEASTGEGLGGISRCSDAISMANSAGEWWSIEPRVGRVVYGLPNRVDRLKCLGNAVVPQIVRVIGETIREEENRR